MRRYEATGIGIFMGVLYGVILWASVDSLSTASFILYNDTTRLPILVTGVIIILAFVCLFSYPYWAGRLEQMIVYSFTKDNEEDEDE
jgi:hypothetical protein